MARSTFITKLINSKAFKIWSHTYFETLIKEKKYDFYDKVMTNFSESKIPLMKKHLIRALNFEYRHYPSTYEYYMLPLRNATVSDVEALYNDTVANGYLEVEYSELNLY